MHHFHHGCDYKFVRRVLAAEFYHLFRAANAVGDVAHLLGALGVADERCAVESFLYVGELPCLVLRVRPAVAVPQNHFAPRLLRYPGAEVPVGAEYYLLLRRNLFYDFERVAARADYVADLFYARAAIYVRNHCRARVLSLENCELHGLAELFERAARRAVGQYHRLFGVEDFCGFRHKIHARKRYDFRAGFFGLPRQPERVSHIVRDFLNLAAYIVVREYHGAAPFFQFENPFLDAGQLRRGAFFEWRENYRLHRISF